jgi:hypothetical protein
MIAFDPKGLEFEEYDHKRKHDMKQLEEAKKKWLHGDFKKAFYNDNGQAIDPTGRKIKKAPIHSLGDGELSSMQASTRA